MPHESSGDAADRRPDDRAAEDAAWRAIIDNYGDRPEMDDPAEEPPEYVAPVPDPDQEEPAAERAEEHFVPPPPPPVPLADPARLAGWVGLFGVPPFVLAALVLNLPIPSWLGVVLMVWFVGGFVFLVATMRPGPRDEGDDGAVV